MGSLCQDGTLRSEDAQGSERTPPPHILLLNTRINPSKKLYQHPHGTLPEWPMINHMAMSDLTHMRISVCDARLRYAV